MQLSEATSSPSLASLALLANAPAGQTAPSDGGLFAEIFAALAQTPSLNTNAPLIANTLDTEPSLGAGPQTPVARKPEASASPTPNTSNVLPATGGADSQSAASRLVSMLGFSTVPQISTSNPVAPQPTTPSPTPAPVVQTPQAQLASLAKPSAPPAKPSKKEPEPAHPAQSSQLSQIPLILPALQTPEPFAPSTNSPVQPSSTKATTDQSTAPAPSPANNTAPAPNTGNLSFAMRIAVDSQPASDPKSQSTPEQGPTTAPAPQSPDAIAPAPAAAQIHAQQQDDKPAPEQHTPSPTESLIATATESTVPVSETHPAHTSQPTASAPASEIEPQQTASTNEPLRNMHIQLTGDDNQRVNVHLVDRGGELRLSVKSPDPALAQTMQEHMPELTSRLEQQRYQTEVWMPKETASSSSSNNNSNSNGSSNPGDGNPGGRQNGQQQQQQNRPEWLDDLEDNPRRPQTTRRN